MRFAEPWALLALLLVPLLLIVRRAFDRRRASQISRAGDPRLFAALVDAGPWSGRIRAAETALFAVAIALVAVALARPQFGLRTEVQTGRGMDLVVALDLSRSMLARDVVPSRLERAKIELGVLLDRLRGDRIGLVGFTSVALPLCPLTVDHAAVRLRLKSADPSALPRGGTSVSAAISAARKLLEAAGRPGSDRAIVLVTDGEAHQGDAFEAARQAKEAGIAVHAVGIGSRIGEPIPTVDDRGKVTGYVRDASGKTVVSRLDEEGLARIAESGGGKVAVPAGDGDIDLGPVTRHLLSLRRAELEARTIRTREERFLWALVPAFLFLLAATLLRPTRRPGLPRVVLGVGLALAPGSASAQEATGLLRRNHPDIEQGHRELAAGRPDAAREAFDRAAAALGEDPRIAYDRALADAARGELDAAMTGFSAAARSDDPSLRARAQLGRGNALRRLKRYDEAHSAYREALLDDPGLSAARRNLELTAAMKAIMDAQPPPEDGEPGDPDENGDKEDEQDEQEGQDSDAGTSDGGGADAGTNGDPDAGADGGASEPEADPDEGSDAGASEAGSSSQDEGRDAGRDEPESSDAGVGPDAGPKAGAPPQDEPPEADLDRQAAEAILDALQAEEKALERKRLLERFQGLPVEKDW